MVMGDTFFSCPKWVLIRLVEVSNKIAILEVQMTMVVSYRTGADCPLSEGHLVLIYKVL